jgi:hypothetical protein
MYILERYPNLVTVSDSNGSSIILNLLSKLPSHFQSGNNLGFWKRCIYHCKYFLEVNSFVVLTLLKHDISYTIYQVFLWNLNMEIQYGMHFKLLVSYPRKLIPRGSPNVSFSMKHSTDM